MSKAVEARFAEKFNPDFTQTKFGDGLSQSHKLPLP
jgi:hypothetical protein